MKAVTQKMMQAGMDTFNRWPHMVAGLMSPSLAQQIFAAMQEASEENVRPSYHDLHITTATIPRTSIFDLPYNIRVICTRAAGWEVWEMPMPGFTDFEHARRLAGEYTGDREKGLVLDVAGTVIVDNLTPKGQT